MRKVPLTLLLGAAILLISQLLLALDVHHRGRIVIGPHFPDPNHLPAPQSTLTRLARLTAFNITPLSWLAYLLILDGLLTLLARIRNLPDIASTRTRPNRFLLCLLTSVTIWCWFDWINFHFLDAWRYFGLPPQFSQRLLGYLIAFAAINPAMFLTAQLYLNLFPNCPLRGKIATIPPPPTGPFSTSARILVALFLALGLLMTIYPFLARNPLGCLTLWTSLFFLLDPLTFLLGGPSILGDWLHRRFARTLALMAGGLTCGFLWELWNYWALTKWSYHLPFLGPLENYRYFEMPWPGMLGFLPFALETWAAFNLLDQFLHRLGLHLTEPVTTPYSTI